MVALKTAASDGITQGSRETGAGAGRRRAIAILGPFQSGKTTLLEALLARTGAIPRAGSVKAGASVGDASAEARAHAMGVEANIATTTYLGDEYSFIDCPGSVEFPADAAAAVALCDAAIVVCEADARKAPALQVILHALEDLGVPRLLFLNKIDIASSRVRETLAMLQPASRVPLLLRQIPIWRNGIATGYVDLASERAYIYREHAESARVDVPAEEIAREREARFSMLERLADYDDVLMEALIDDMEPPRDRVFADLAIELRAGHIVPVFMGAAERGHGITRLLKALRHEAPDLGDTLRRLEVPAEGPALAHIIKTLHTAHGGKLSIARILRGRFGDGDAVTLSSGEETRITGVSRLMGQGLVRQSEAMAGEVVALGRMEAARTGTALGPLRNRPEAPVALALPQPALAITLRAAERRDDVRLAAALARLSEEDPALSVEPAGEGGQLILRGQGEMQLRIIGEKLAARFGIATVEGRPPVGYRETIRQTATARGRHKKQTGGHGQFGDVVLKVAPLARGLGFRFIDAVTGGAVPRAFIPAVEEGARLALREGPLGFPVVDVEVTLEDGSAHPVDSSDLAFQLAAGLALREALAQASPVLLEPILAVDIAVPDDAIQRATKMVAARRGQVVGMDARPGWSGWHLVAALVPEGEIGALIVELRSATAGVGAFTSVFDHRAEVNGKVADTIVGERRRTAA